MRNVRNAFAGLFSGSLLRWAGGQKWSLLLLTAGNIILAVTGLWTTLYTRDLIDGAVMGNFSALLQAGAGLVLLTVVGISLRAGMDGLSESARSRMVNEMRRELMTALMRKEYGALSAYHSGDFTGRIMSDVRIVCEGVTGIVPPLAHMTAKLAGAVVVLMSIDWKFTCLLGAIGVILLLLGMVIRPKMQGLHGQVRQAGSDVQSMIQELLGNIRLIKASRAEKTVVQRLELQQGQYYAVQMRRKRMSMLANAGLAAVFEGCWLLTMLWGGYSVLRGNISYGTLTAMVQLVGQIHSPFAGMSAVLQRFYAMEASADRLQELLKLPDEPTGGTCPEYVTGLVLEDVEFSYGKEPVLQGVSGYIEQGDMVAVTGLSGGGKSSLFFVLLGIYSPTGGRVYFPDSGILVSPSTRGAFAYVPQGNTLFSGTLRENLTLFRPSAIDEEILAAARFACVEELICEIGLDACLGERGLGISEGQAQRIALARGLLSDAPVLLLDEVTAALDEKTESALLQNLAALGKTCLIVTHRPAALDICNKRLHLENGCGVIESIR